DPGEQEVLDAARPQDQLEVGRTERALARLVDHDLAGVRRELRHDLPSGLAAHEDAPARPGIADPDCDAPRPPPLVRRQIGQIGPMSLARVEGGKRPRPRPPSAHPESPGLAPAKGKDRPPYDRRPPRPQKNPSA